MTICRPLRSLATSYILLGPHSSRPMSQTTPSRRSPPTKYYPGRKIDREDKVTWRVADKTGGERGQARPAVASLQSLHCNAVRPGCVQECNEQDSLAELCPC